MHCNICYMLQIERGHGKVMEEGCVEMCLSVTVFEDH